MKKIIFFSAIALFIFVGIYWIITANFIPKNNSEQVNVVTTLFPQYDLTKAIGQEKVSVHLLLPPGMEAHSFEPTPSDIIKINQADLFIFTGENMEPWANDIGKSLNPLVKIVDVSEGVKLLDDHRKNEDDDDGHHDEDEDDHHHDDASLNHQHNADPHIWLDLTNTQIMGDNILSALIATDPGNSAYYQANWANYRQQLQQLDSKYLATLSNCQIDTIIYGGHYAFGYLAKRYGLNYLSAQGFSPNAEPTANDLINLVNQIKQNSISYIFYEELTSPKIAETLAKETNTKLLFLNAAHNLSKNDFDNNITFISIMENNLQQLSIGLNCAITTNE